MFLPPHPIQLISTYFESKRILGRGFSTKKKKYNQSYTFISGATAPERQFKINFVHGVCINAPFSPRNTGSTKSYWHFVVAAENDY